MSKNITLNINNAKETLESVKFQTASGQALRIPAQADVNYQLIDDLTQFGPENIMTNAWAIIWWWRLKALPSITPT